MVIILLAIPLLFTWAVVHGGTRKKMPPPPNLKQHDDM